METIEDGSRIGGALRGAIEWTKTFLMLVGLVAVIGFIRVNYFGADISVSLPEYVPASIAPAVADMKRVEREMNERLNAPVMPARRKG